MRIAITADHNGVPLKRRLSARLEAGGHLVDDRGGHVGEEPVDYPPLCEDVCREVIAGRADYAFVVGGGGSGETIACNKLRGIRAVACPSVWQSEIARFSVWGGSEPSAPKRMSGSARTKSRSTAKRRRALHSGTEKTAAMPPSLRRCRPVPRTGSG